MKQYELAAFIPNFSLPQARDGVPERNRSQRRRAGLQARLQILPARLHTIFDAAAVLDTI